MAERCEMSDLPVDQCAHCLKHVDPEQQARREADALLGRPGWVPARFASACYGCGGWYGPGAPIHIDTEGRGWIGPCCAAPDAA